MAITPKSNLILSTAAQVYYIVNFKYSMMQNTLDSVTSPTYSLNEHAIKLNSSSIASSTPECSGQLLVFEEYPECQEKLKGGMKRNLRILIEEDFDYGKDMQEVGEREEGGWSDSQRKQYDNCDDNEDYDKDGDSLEEDDHYIRYKHYDIKIDSHIIPVNKGHRAVSMLKYQNQEYQQQHYIAQLNHLNEYQKDYIESLHSCLRKKDDQLQQYQRHNADLQYQLTQLKQLHSQDSTVEYRLREKYSKIKYLQKLYEKIVAMNKLLQKYLKDSDRKIMYLYKEVQRSVCNREMENLAKLKDVRLKYLTIKSKESLLNKETMLTKESVLNKENTVLINGMKSLEKRKAVGSLARKLGRLTSTGNLAKKSMKGN